MTPGEHPSCLLFLGTEDGIRVARLGDGGLEVRSNRLAGNAVRAISVDPRDPTEALVGCGLRGWGLHRVTDTGVEQLGFDDRWVWGVTRHPNDPETIYVGTEPPMLYRSTDSGSTFDSFGGIEDLPSRPDWKFFHAPFEEGHVHGIAIHPDRPDRIYAGVEHGALIYSIDGGETWAETLVGSDVHRVAVDPEDPDHVLAGTGSGLFRSLDGGREWHRTPDLRGLYVHGILFDRRDRTRLLVYVAEEDAPIRASDDGGETWSSVADGLPAARPADTLRQHPSDPETLLYCGDSDHGTSHLFVSTDDGGTWNRIDRDLPKVWRAEAVPDPG